MKLFELDASYNLVLQPELFLLEDFEKLRDDRKDIKLLYKEIGFIYYTCDLKSDFQFQTDFDLRQEEVKKYVGLPEKWKPDALLINCIKTYKYLSQTVASKLLESAYLAIDKVSKQANSIDLNERDKNDKPIWSMKSFADTVKIIPDLLESMTLAEKAYLKGQAETNKLKGNKEKSLYEDGFKRKKD